MQRSSKTCPALVIFAAASWQAHAQRLNIHVYDLAHASPAIFEEATQEAARVLATSGVEVVWQRPPTDSPEAHATDQSANTVHGAGLTARGYLVARIVSGIPADLLPGALGYSLPDARLGAHATIFYDRVEAIGRTNGINVSTLLGHAMAHEIGHVLLGATPHSPDGIMKARWAKSDYQRAAMGLLEFTPSERAAIRRRLAVFLALKKRS